MSEKRDLRDSALAALLALLTEPEQQAVLAYIGRHGLQRDDDMFVLIAMLKIGALMVIRMADSVEMQAAFAGDMHEMLADARDKLNRSLAAEREALLDRWGDLMGVADDIQRNLAAFTAAMVEHGHALEHRTQVARKLTRAFDQQVEQLRPLLDLLRPAKEKAVGLSPTYFVLDAIQQELAVALQQVAKEQRHHRWWRLGTTCAYRAATIIGLGMLLYRI
ncbi:hypothetical protein BV96_01252 [Sphingomonas paucimobilis]|nr:hypothetical protein BV96_01252 [Sphingomonas paucimobilis]